MAVGEIDAVDEDTNRGQGNLIPYIMAVGEIDAVGEDTNRGDEAPRMEKSIRIKSHRNAPISLGNKSIFFQ